MVKRKSAGNTKNPPCYEDEDGIGWVNKKRASKLLRVTVPRGCTRLVVFSSTKDAKTLSYDVAMSLPFQTIPMSLLEPDIINNNDQRELSQYCDVPCTLWQGSSSSKPPNFFVFQFVAYNATAELARSQLFFIYEGKLSDSVKRKAYIALSRLLPALVPATAHRHLASVKLCTFWEGETADELQKKDNELEPWVRGSFYLD